MTSGTPLMSDVLGSPSTTQSKARVLFLLSQSWHDHAARSSMLQFRVSREAPMTRQPPVHRHPSLEGVRGVPGCRWKATVQVNPTISQGNFSL